MAIPEFVATLVVEAAVHHLDLVVDLPQSDPGEHAMAAVRDLYDELLEAPLPCGWDDKTYALKGAGRLALDGHERAQLGKGADRFPLIG